MPQTKFDSAYAALTQLANDTSKEVGSVLCRVVLGVDVSFTRTKSSYLSFGVVTQHEGLQQLNLYNAATYIANC